MHSTKLFTVIGAIALSHAESISTKRDSNCTANALGKGPVASPDTVYSFLDSPDLASFANNASTPSNYTQSFKNLKAAVQDDKYLGYVLLDSYNTNSCASNCTAKPDCQGFNIFFERDPTEGPGPDCSNPPSTTTIKCTLWGVAVTSKNAVNSGQTNANFSIAMAGSNGYNNAKAGNVQGAAKGTATRGSSISDSAKLFLVLLPLLLHAMA